MKEPYVVATISMERVLQETVEGSRRIQLIRDMEEPKKLEFQRLVSEMQSLKNKILDATSRNEGGEDCLSDETRAMAALFQEKQREAAAYQEETLPSLEKNRLESMAEFEKNVFPIIDEYCRQQNIDLLFPYPMRWLIFASNRLDITDAIIARIDNKGTVGGASG